MRFEDFIDVERLPDSMCFDSGTDICHYEDGDDTIDIEVRGHVKVDYNGETYRHYSDMPDELQKMFADGSAYDNDNVVIDENNWYEVFYNWDEQFDVAEIEGIDTINLKKYCKDCMELFRTH